MEETTPTVEVPVDAEPTLRPGEVKWNTHQKKHCRFSKDGKTIKMKDYLRMIANGLPRILDNTKGSKNFGKPVNHYLQIYQVFMAGKTNKACSENVQMYVNMVHAAHGEVLRRLAEEEQQFLRDFEQSDLSKVPAAKVEEITSSPAEKLKGELKAQLTEKGKEYRKLHRCREQANPPKDPIEGQRYKSTKDGKTYVWTGVRWDELI
jgi:hypothetical protein